MGRVLSSILSQRVRIKVLPRLAKTPIKQQSRPKLTSNNSARSRRPRPRKTAKTNNECAVLSRRSHRTAPPIQRSALVFEDLTRVTVLPVLAGGGSNRFDTFT